MTLEQHLGAVFVDHAAAEAAVSDLRALGLADEHLGVAVHQPDGYVFEEDTEATMALGAEKGVALGAPIGAIAGMAVMALVVPGLGTLGVGGVLAAGGLSGALAGTYVGALLGLAAEEKVLDEEWDWERVPLEPGQMLVVIASHGHPEQVTDILQRHGGHLIAKPPHIG